MARFNKESITDDSVLEEKMMMECAMYLQACLSNEDLERLEQKWKEAGGLEKIKWWQFCFENIKVSI